MTGRIEPASSPSLNDSSDEAVWGHEALFDTAGRPFNRLEGGTIDRPYDFDAASPGRLQIPTNKI
ncbi:MAG: hypothetical protein CMN06_13960 [Roseibacillus sp.]|nr:hypothetical protein [Roseibacillus sp.]